MLASGLGLAATVALLIVVGASRALLDVASRTLMQRSVPAQLLGRVFGVLEGLTMAGLAAGALLVPALASLGGSRLALLGVAAVLPLAAAPALEGLAGALTSAMVPAGTVLIRQGDPGDAYYAIAAGEVGASQDGQFLRRCGRGEGVGEIALLHAIPRTATVAHTTAIVYKLDRELFLIAVLGHAPSQRQADRIVGIRLAAGGEPGGGDTAG